LLLLHAGEKGTRERCAVVADAVDRLTVGLIAQAFAGREAAGLSPAGTRVGAGRPIGIQAGPIGDAGSPNAGSEREWENGRGAGRTNHGRAVRARSEEHTSELQ